MVIVRPWALRQTLRVLALAVVLAAATRGHGVLANPQGGTVAAGDAEIVTTSASRIDINQHSDRAIINWESFDIGAGEHTHFEQPSATAFALNRVAGSNITEIFGALTATGRIAIVNPHGIHFGPTSQVDVAGLVVTTTDIRDSPFMAGSLFFDLPSPHNGRIVNEGRITLADAGLLAFVAPGVENTGTITARLGRVSLASGNAFTLDLFGDNLVNLAVGDAVAGNIAGVDQIGTIVADGGLLQISAEVAEGVVDRVINMSGIVEARSIGSTGGRIVLDGGNSGDVEVSGVLTASGTEAGEMSGTVTVTGASVTLASTARIAATGDTGGGTVFIGGEFGGSGETRTADTTTVQSGALIDASALTSGDGGQVAIWADESTRFDGFILAKGGSDSGNGGYVETSGASIAFAGTVDTSAPNGSGGTWLIDPDTLNIGATEAATIVTALGNGTSVNAEATTTTNLNSAIDSSAQVTTATLTFGDEGAPTGLTINLNAAITLGSNQTLTGQGTTVNVASTGLIQNGIDVALAGTSTRVNVAAGTFSEDVNFNKQLILSFDSNTGVTINSLSAPDSSTLRAMLGILTATNGFAIQSPMVLGTPQLATSSANVRFTKAVDGTSSDQTLSINAGTGQVRFDSTIGSTTSLQIVDITGDTIITNGVTTSGGQRYTGAAQLSGDYSAGVSSGITFRVTGAATLSGATAITATTGGGTINFQSTVDGSNSLTISASSSTITFSAAIGRTTALTFTSITGSAVSVQDITTSGGQSFGGPVQLNGAYSAGVTSGLTFRAIGAVTLGGGATITATTGGGTIRFASTVDGSNSLTIDASSSTIEFQGTVGGTTAPTFLSITGNSITSIGATTSGGQLYSGPTQIQGIFSAGESSGIAFRITGAATLDGTTSIVATSGSGSVDFQSTLDGSQALNIRGPSNAVTLSGAVGGTSTLVSLEVTGSTISLPNVQTSGNQTYTGTVTLNSDYTTGGGSFTIAGATTLGSGTSVTTSNGSVTFGAVDGANTLTINAGAGDVTLDATGATTALTGITVTGGSISLNNVATTGTQTYTGSVTLNGASYVTGGSGFTVTGATTLGTGVTLTTTNGDAAFRTIDGGQTLTINAGTGSVTLTAVGATTAIGALTVTGGTISLSDVSTSGAQNYTGTVTLNSDYSTSGGAFTITGATTLASGATISTSNGAVTLGTLDGANSLTVNAGTGDVTIGNVGATTSLSALTISGGSISLSTVTTNGAQSYTGATTLNGSTYLTGGSAFSVIGATTLGTDVTLTTSNGAATFGAIDGGQSLTISAGTGDVTIGVAGATTALTSLTVTGGTITLSSITTNGLQNYTGSTTLNGSAYTTNGAAFTVTGASTLGSGATITTANGTVTVGTIDGGNALTVSAGTGDVVLGVVGATTALTGLTVTGGTITLSNVTTSGVQSYSGTTSLASAYVTGGGSFAVNGAGTLTTTTAITTTNAGLSFNGTLDGAQSLTLTTGTGTITFAGTVGSTAQPATLTIVSAGDVTVQASMNVGAFVQSSGTGTTDFGNLSLTASGDVSVSTKNISGAITGEAVSLLASDSISATVSVTSLSLTGNSAVLNGTIGGTGGDVAVLTIVFSGGVGAGPYTFNGLPIILGDSVASNGQTFSPEIVKPMRTCTADRRLSPTNTLNCPQSLVSMLQVPHSTPPRPTLDSLLSIRTGPSAPQSLWERVWKQFCFSGYTSGCSINRRSCRTSGGRVRRQSNRHGDIKCLT